MHAEVLEWLAAKAEEYGPFERVIEFGSRNLNGSARDVIPHKSWFGVDVVAGPGVDLVANAVHAVVNVGYWDLGICTNVFEHDPTWAHILRNLISHVKSGGYLFLQCPGPGFLPHSARDVGPLQEGEYYANVSADEIVRVVGTFDARIKVLEAGQGGWCGYQDSLVVLRKS